MKYIARLLVVSLFLFAFTSCGKSNNSGQKGSKDNPVKIGVTSEANTEYVELKKNCEENGIYVDIVGFQDYTSANPALSSKQLDMNQFQHILYLADYNKNNGEDLKPIGSTALYPIGIYSNKYKKVDKIPANSQIAIPNDTTNQSRAIHLLESLGLVKLNTTNIIVGPENIDKKSSKITVTPLEATQTANAVSDPKIAASVINNDFIGDANLTYNDAIATENANSSSIDAYINIFAVRNEDVDNELYEKIVTQYHKKNVIDAMKEQSSGTGIEIERAKSELIATLEQLEKEV
jgi:D-methionine transport system substrate-binding protein